MNKRIFDSIITSVVVVGAVAAVALLFTNTQSDWYLSLEKPSFQPSAPIFAIGWSVLYALYAASLSLLQINGAKTDKVYIFYGLMGLFNILWCLFFFTLEMPVAALAAIILYIVATVYSFLLARQTSPLSAYLLIPSIIWLLFATALNIGIIVLN